MRSTRLLAAVLACLACQLQARRVQQLLREQKFSDNDVLDEKKSRSLALLSLALRPSLARRQLVRAALFGGGLSLMGPALAAEPLQPSVVNKQVVMPLEDGKTKVVLPIIDEKQKLLVKNYMQEPPPKPPPAPAAVVVAAEKPKVVEKPPAVVIASEKPKIVQPPTTTTLAGADDKQMKIDLDTLKENNFYPDLLKEIEVMRGRRAELTNKIVDGESEASKLREDISSRTSRLTKVEGRNQQWAKMRTELDQDLLESETSLFKILESSTALLEKMKTRRR